MTPEEQLKLNYHCPKCRSTACVVHHLTIPVNVLPLPVGRYLATTCNLCGYTEFYDQAVYETVEKPLKVKVPAHDIGPAT